jgi:hypothetical protein
MYDTDLNPSSLVDYTLEECRALYMIDYGIALRGDVAAIPIAGMAH